MRKLITDQELLQILHMVINERVIDDRLVYAYFLMSLASLIADYCGGEAISVSPPAEDGLPWKVTYQWNENLPEDGGVFANFDTDISVDEWRMDATTDGY